MSDHNECPTCLQDWVANTDYECGCCGRPASEHIRVTSLCRILRETQQRENALERERNKHHEDADAFLDKWSKAQERAIGAERERDEARKELDALKAMIAKSGLIEVEATTCIADKCGKPTIVKNGTMLVHKDENLRMQQRTVDLQKHAATARKLAAERALADRLAEVLEGIWPFIEEDIPHGCNSTAYMNAIELCRANITAWKEARSE